MKSAGIATSLLGCVVGKRRALSLHNQLSVEIMPFHPLCNLYVTFSVISLLLYRKFSGHP